MVTKERLHQLVDALPDSDLATIERVLEAFSVIAPAGSVADGTQLVTKGRDRQMRIPTAEQVRQQFGGPTIVEGRPPAVGTADLVGDFWPEDEDPDEFESTIRQWREADRRP